jgi:hypothetical protein
MDKVPKISDSESYTLQSEPSRIYFRAVMWKMQSFDRPSDHHLSKMLVPTFVDRRCHVVSVTYTYGRILEFLGGSLMVNSLGYKPEGCEFETRRGEILNLPNPSGRTRPWGLLSL